MDISLFVQSRRANIMCNGETMLITTKFLWSILRNDAQTGFTIGAFALVAGMEQHRAGKSLRRSEGIIWEDQI
jgi:hypothetical protein